MRFSGVRIFSTLAVLSTIVSSAYAEVTISQITPSAGLAIGGEYIHVHGHDLIGLPLACAALTCANYVKLGDSFANIVSNTDDEIVALTPAHSAGTVDVEINVAGKTVPPRIITAGYQFVDSASDDLTRFLVPVSGTFAGAFGSTWRTTVLVHNSGTDPVPIILGSQTLGIPPGAPPPISALTTAKLSLSNSTAGMFLYIPARYAPLLTFSARVADTSRDAENFGTEIPIVPESQFKPAIQIIGIPTDGRFRSMLRIYVYDGMAKALQVDVRDEADSSLLATILVDALPANTLPGTDPPAPGYSQLDLTPVLAKFVAHPSVRAEVVSRSMQPAPIWAFISITNNQTQLATALTPSLGRPLPTPKTPLAAGHWAGGGACLDVDVIQVRVSAGACGGGSFSRPNLGPDGRFEADGVYGIAVGPPPPPSVTPPMAHFSGFVNGNTLQLTIITSQLTLPFTLQYGSMASCPAPCP